MHVQVPLPMLASAVDEAFDAPDYSFEVKWDGLRCLCAVDDGTVQLFSRNRRDMTRQFPELHDIHRAFSTAQALFDGELCVFSEQLPDFDTIRRRNVLDAERAIIRAATETPATYIVFDTLRLAGEDVMQLPWSERRRRLEAVWNEGPGAVLSDTVPERGRALFAAVTQQGLEGIIAKRHDAPYVAGRRTRHWLKVRNQAEIDCVVGGFVPRGSSDFASLALGLYVSGDGDAADTDRLVYVGNVGTGFPTHKRHQLMQRLVRLHTARPPFGPTVPSRPSMRWVVPTLVCRVAYLQFTPAGHLRHATFRGIRDDKSPRACTWPPERW